MYTRKKILLLLLILGIALFHGLRLSDDHDLGGDFSMYIHHAKNLVEGIPYNETGYLFNPHIAALGPPAYPPVYPLLLAPVYFFFGLNLLAMKWQIIGFFSLWLGVYVMIFHRILHGWTFWGFLVLLGFHPYWAGFTERILSDIPFLLWTYLGFGLIMLKPRWEQSRRHRTGYACVLGILFYAAYGTRSVGLVLLPSLWLYEWLTKKRISWETWLASGCFVIGALLQAHYIDSGSGYWIQFVLEPTMIFENLGHYLKAWFLFWDNGGYSRMIRWITAGIVGGLGLFGYWICLKKDRFTICEVFVVLYWGPILFWSSPQGIRLLLPILPLMMGYAVAGFQRVVQSLSRRRKCLMTSLLLSLLFVTYAGQYLKQDSDIETSGVRSPEVLSLFEIVTHHTATDAIFMFSKPRILALFTDRQATGLYQPQTYEAFWSYLQEVPVSYVIVEPEDLAFIQGFLACHPNGLQLKWTQTPFRIFRVQHT